MALHVCYECLGVVAEDWENCQICGRMRPASGWGLDPLEGLVLADRYRLAHRLGEGGMGSVYRAERVGTLGGFVAVKILSPHLSKTVLAKRFEREARSLSKLSSPHIVRVYDFDTFAYPVDGQPLYFIAMEVVEGSPLSNVLRDKGGQVPFAWALDVLRQTARGLDEAHELGIVHRDLKPSNLMIIQQRRSTHVKILDFGIAAITEEPGEETEKLTRTGLVTGTPDYMAPEQAMGKEIGPAADMYSLGIIAYQMFTGTLPFAGPTAMAKLTKRLTEDPPPLRDKVPPPALPEGIYDIVDRLLAREPENRFEDAAALLDALAPFHTGDTSAEMALGGEGGGGASILTPFEGSPVVDQAMRTEIVNDRGERKVKPSRASDGAGKSKLPLIVALVLLLGGGGAAAWYFTAGPGGSSDKPAVTAEAKPKADKKKSSKKSSKKDAKKSAKKDAKKSAKKDAKKGSELGTARPPLDDQWRAPITAFLPGAMTLKIAMPKEKVPLYRPLELQLAIDHGPTALVLGSAKVTVTPVGGTAPIGTAEGKPSRADGRVFVSLPPLPSPVRYVLDVQYSIPDRSDGRVKLVYDAAASDLKTP